MYQLVESPCMGKNGKLKYSGRFISQPIWTKFCWFDLFERSWIFSRFFLEIILYWYFSTIQFLFSTLIKKPLQENLYQFPSTTLLMFQLQVPHEFLPTKTVYQFKLILRNVFCSNFTSLLVNNLVQPTYLQCQHQSIYHIILFFWHFKSHTNM